MKTALTKGWRWLLGILVSILGFEGCDKIGLFRCEYGEPHADYKLIGDVKDTKGNPIKGIRVVYDRLPEEEEWGKDTLYTDQKGHFEKDVENVFWHSGSLVKFEDADGAENGSYRSKTLTQEDLVFEQTKKGDKHWYSGAYSVHADAILEEDN